MSDAPIPVPAVLAGNTPVEEATPEKYRHAEGRSRRSGFFREIVRNPCSVGAVAQTSQRLAHAIVRASNVMTATQIVELGAGVGAITRQILLSKKTSARVLAIERNPGFASSLKARFPGLRVVCGCAGQLRRHASAHRFEQVDTIISALPWTSFSGAAQREILEATEELLAVDGVFTTIACLGLHLTAPGRRFRGLLHEIFPTVEALPATWLNLPPAFVYRCAKSPG